MDDAHALLLTVTGRDRPGLTTSLCEALDESGARILDMEQVVIRDRLVLGILASPSDDELTRSRVTATAGRLGIDVEFEPVARHRPAPRRVRHSVVVLGQPLRARSLAAVTRAIAECGANIDRIVRLSRYPILSFEFLVSGGDAGRLPSELTAAAAAERVDVAVQRTTLYRRAKRLVVMDVDSTLVQDEVVELLAAHAGHAERVAALTTRAMNGELDFAEALRERVALLKGLPVEVLEETRAALRLTPGARTLVRTLKRLGFTLAIVSGGFSQITDPLAEELGLDYAYANTLAIENGRLTGELVGPILDSLGKVAALEQAAASAGVPIGQTVAIGDGANDAPMLARAGLGVAFNAKQPARAAADTAVSVPYLDAILFLLGITREEIEDADSEDPLFSAGPVEPIPDF